MGICSIASCTRRSVVYLGLAISSRGPGRRPLTAIWGVPSSRLAQKTNRLGRMQWGVVGFNQTEFSAILSAIFSRPKERSPCCRGLNPGLIVFGDWPTPAKRNRISRGHPLRNQQNLLRASELFCLSFCGTGKSMKSWFHFRG